jgi:uncharacterized protein YdeI (YjbR/CyaY-like superfamily)
MNPGLRRDAEGVLEPQGPNSQTPGMIRFTAVGQVGGMAPVIRAYLRQFMDHAEAGTKPKRWTPTRNWQAKTSPTRVARIEKFRDKIIAGKGALER